MQDDGEQRRLLVRVVVARSGGGISSGGARVAIGAGEAIGAGVVSRGRIAGGASGGVRQGQQGGEALGDAGFGIRGKWGTRDLREVGSGFGI